MADIFVSYASEDRPRIEPLVSELEGAGYSVWWDRQLKGGTRFSSEIESEVRHAGVVLVAWSPNAVKSRWVADEADLALETGNLLPISLDGARSPMGFRQLQTIDFSGWTGGTAPCMNDLLEALKLHTQGGKRKPNQSVSLPAMQKTKSDASIAVLPFINMSSDPEQEFFSDGISEELLNLLAKISGLAVIARTSSFSFKGSDKSIEEIAAILDVAFVLEGSVRKAGNRVRITAQLIECTSSHHVWSETYDRTLEDIFAVQDEIAAAIVDELKGIILGGEHMTAPQSTKSSSVSAYEHYMLGQQYIIKRTRADIETAKKHFDSALELDPDYAPAMAGLADAILLLSNDLRCYGTTPLMQARATARPLIERALELNPDAFEAHAAKALYHSFVNENAQSITHARRATELNPSYGRAYIQLSMALSASGDPTAPIMSVVKKAYEVDPTSILILQNLSAQYLNRLRTDDVRKIVRQMEAIDSSSYFAPFTRGAIEQMEGNFFEALKIYLSIEDHMSLGLLMYNVQFISTVLGHGEMFEEYDTASAFEVYSAVGPAERADALAPKVLADEKNLGIYDTMVCVAEWQVKSGEFEAALDTLRPFDDPDPDNWSQLYRVADGCYGAFLSWYARKHIGKTASAALYLEKIKQMLAAAKADPDGANTAVFQIEYCIDVAEDNLEKAMDVMEAEMGGNPLSPVFTIHSPILAPLHDHPRFKAIVTKIEDHIANERRLAEEAGIFDRLKTRLAE